MPYSSDTSLKKSTAVPDNEEAKGEEFNKKKKEGGVGGGAAGLTLAAPIFFLASRRKHHTTPHPAGTHCSRNGGKGSVIPNGVGCSEYRWVPSPGKLTTKARTQKSWS